MAIPTGPMSPTRPTLLLTRPRAQSVRFAAECRERLGQDLVIVISPIQEIAYRSPPVNLRDYQGIIATSVNGIEALARIADVQGQVAYCVGDRTAEVATGLGMRAISAQGDAGDLVDLIRGTGAKGSLLYACGAVTRGDVQGALAGAGVAVTTAVVYEQVPADLSVQARALLMSEGRIVLPLFSPRSAGILGRCVGPAVPKLDIVALSPAVAAAWTGPAPHSLLVSARPDAISMLDALSRHLDGESA